MRTGVGVGVGARTPTGSGIGTGIRIGTARVRVGDAPRSEWERGDDGARARAHAHRNGLAEEDIRRRGRRPNSVAIIIGVAINIIIAGCTTWLGSIRRRSSPLPLLVVFPHHALPEEVGRAGYDSRAAAAAAGRRVRARAGRCLDLGSCYLRRREGRGTQFGRRSGSTRFGT